MNRPAGLRMRHASVKKRKNASASPCCPVQCSIVWYPWHSSKLLSSNGHGTVSRFQTTSGFIAGFQSSVVRLDHSLSPS